MAARTLVVAIGGNSLIKDSKHQTVPDQIAALHETSGHIAALVRDGYNGVVSLETHWRAPDADAAESSRRAFAGLRGILERLGG